VFKTISTTLNHWRQGIRLYIGCATALVTLEVWWWASVSYSGSILFATRIEEVYAWLALGLIVLAISIGPVYSVWPRLPGRRLLADGRRLFGVSGAWFASLHATIAYVALFKTANPLSLPQNYQQSFALAALALLILLAMAFTSFDRAFRGMGIWWFRLHRFVYLAVLLSLLHAFMIGSHATQWPTLIILTLAAIGLLGLHSYIAFVRAERATIWQLLAIGAAAILLIAILNYGYGQKLGYNPIEGKQHHRRT
jgi:methionine sulfoxide reductase heme-binding subunit